MLNELFDTLLLIFMLLLAGVIVRNVIKPLQRMFFPASVIGGLIGLILGPQVLGLINIPDNFPNWNGFLMKIIMICVIFGVDMSISRLAEHLDYALANIFLYGTQMLIGTLIAMAFYGMYSDMPKGYGILATFAYFGSHSGAALAGGVLEEYGSGAGAVDIGLILATGGLIWSMVVGMAVVNYGIRKGWATFVKNPEKQPDSFYGGLLPVDERRPIGYTRTTPLAVSPLAVQFCLIFLCYFVGMWIFKLLIHFIPVLGKISAMLYGMIGALIMWPVLKALKKDQYVDRPTLTQINNFALDILIVTAMASMNLDIVSKYWLPLLVNILIGCGFTSVFVLWWFKKIGMPQWFEKCMMVFGTCTGSSPNGLALVRAMDPNGESVAPTAHGVYNGVFWWNNLLTPVLPIVILTNLPLFFAIACAFPVGALIIAAIAFPKIKKAAQGK